jgi:uroporphyrinogen III methyltransferase / synthase
MSGLAGAARPLAGRRIAVTRPRAQAPPLLERLEAAGASVLAVPTIAIEPPESWAPLDAALEQLADYRWAVFTSANGVAMVRRRVTERGAAAFPAPAGLRIAAIGPATAEALRAWGLGADLVPEEYVAEGLAARLRELIGPGDRVLLPRAAETRDVLVRELEAVGARVDEVAAYRTRPAAEAGELRAALAAGRVDMVTFTSSSTVRHFAALFAPGELRALMAGVEIACIGPVTAATATDLGLRPHIVADEYTIPALAGAIVRHYRVADGGGARPVPEGADPPAHEPTTRS